VTALAGRVAWMLLGGAITLACAIAVMASRDEEWCARPDHLCGEPGNARLFAIDERDIIRGADPVCDCIFGDVGSDAIGMGHHRSNDEDPCGPCDYTLERRRNSAPPATAPGAAPAASVTGGRNEEAGLDR
jgi:hypothetical protein